MKRFSALLISTLLFATQGMAASVAESSAQINPLSVGAAIPAATLSNLDGEPVTVTALADKPTIAVFYRGGWCPYCNRHLKELQGIQQELLDMGYQIVGISPDKAEGLKKTTEGEELKYQLLSDSKGDAARAFGIAFNAAKEYASRGPRIVTMLENASGEKHHQLPVPAVFILKNGKVAYSYVNADYRTRLSAEELIKAAKSSR
ncbi:peroxiredoxin-like family protein [Porticoccus sp. W117]|uniref:peroxiredoxin-like family protein n=1 Tax=Porticoccus sp. W117 TaxID=3054777 RepID=UPI0025942065|nr:peroxiredoxin-like family protein [Porticoccus sp. W117]MDM3870692.1 peroxiredoxin-like family protein [Porticoccus sp. W117]